MKRSRNRTEYCTDGNLRPDTNFFHSNCADQNQFIHFLKNVAIVGSLHHPRQVYPDEIQ
jgi:hypothetical protein